MENNGRYSYEQVELHGDHTQDNEATLVQAVLDHIRTELDPTSAIVKRRLNFKKQNRNWLRQRLNKRLQTKKLSITKLKPTVMGKSSMPVVLNAVAGKTIAYGTNYKELVELIPLAEIGKHYMAHDLITIEDPAHVEGGRRR